MALDRRQWGDPLVQHGSRVNKQPGKLNERSADESPRHRIGEASAAR